jgi:hypothetical protein
MSKLTNWGHNQEEVLQPTEANTEVEEVQNQDNHVSILNQNNYHNTKSQKCRGQVRGGKGIGQAQRGRGNYNNAC